MKVYFIPGLGADEHVFNRLDLPGIERIYLNWFSPAPKETMASYAKRMAEKITEPDPVIVGLSFGGMLAVEIAKQIPVKKVILISSAKSERELPFYFRLGRYVPLQKILPVRVTAFTAPFLFYLFGVKDRSQKEEIMKMVNNSPKDFTRWAINAVVHWRNRNFPGNIVQLHGNTDWLIPYRNIHADHTISNGGHFMIVNKAKEISALLMQLLKK